MGDQSEQFGGQTTSSLMMNDGGATNMKSGAPPHDTMEASATKKLETMARWVEEITS
jgi:hypothetical protein